MWIIVFPCRCTNYSTWTVSCAILMQRLVPVKSSTLGKQCIRYVIDRPRKFCWITDGHSCSNSIPFSVCFVFLVQLCSLERMQFDTLRHAKHSTSLLIHNMLHPEKASLSAVCNYCRLTITARQHWHCRICKDPTFDLCDACARSALRHISHSRHEHPLIFACRGDYEHVTASTWDDKFFHFVWRR